MNTFRLFFIVALVVTFSNASFAQKKTKPQAAPKELKATVNLDKTSALYVGVENPITITAGNANAADVTATCRKGEIKTNDAGQRVLVCNKPGLDTIVATAPDGSTATFNIKIKKLPDPAAKLNGQFVSGTMSAEQLRTCNEIKAVFDNFAYDPKCNISGFSLAYIPKKQEPSTLVSTSAKFDTKIAEQIVKAKVGDYYLFSNISTKCQGDVTARTLAPILILIK